jgi:hypothetical protein
MRSTFHVRTARLSGTATPEVAGWPLPSQSDVIGTWGSGIAAFRHHYTRWRTSDVGGTSRAVFSAFADSIASGSDPAVALRHSSSGCTASVLVGRSA